MMVTAEFMFIVSGINLVAAILVLWGAILNRRTSQTQEIINKCNQSIADSIRRFSYTAAAQYGQVEMDHPQEKENL